VMMVGRHIISGELSRDSNELVSGRGLMSLMCSLASHRIFYNKFVAFLHSLEYHLSQLARYSPADLHNYPR